MLKIGKLTLKEKCRIASSFTDSDIIQSNQNIQPQLVLAYKDNLDIIEVRIDQFNQFDTDYVTTNIKTARELVKSTPIIATIRHPSEDKNSLWQGNERDRLLLFQNIITIVDAIDIELQSTAIINEIINLTKNNNKLSIISCHDFKHTSNFDNLATIIYKSKKLGADIVKIATEINNTNDIRTLEMLTKTYYKENIIIIGMGKKGMDTRTILPTLGSLITFAYHGKPSILGQMSYQETKAKLFKN